MVKDLPDYTNYTAVNVDIDPVLTSVFIPRPKGGVLESDSGETTPSFLGYAERVVTDGYKFHPSKVVISVEKASLVRYRWHDAYIGAPRFLDDMTTLLEHFPYNWYEMEGNGLKAFTIYATSLSETGDIHSEISGEEIAV